jgi:signal transduction histidine kinase
MRSLYVRVFITTIYTMLISTLLGFYVANVYYHWSLKPYNNDKLIGIAQNIRTFAEQYPGTLGDYLQNTAALGYQLYVHDVAGNDIFYGNEFRVLDLPVEIVDQVLAGMEYHGVADFPDKAFITGFFSNQLSNSVGIPVTSGNERFALFLRPDIQLQFGELRIYFALILLFTVLFSIPYFLLSTRFLVQPITRLTEATKRIAQGNYNLQLPTRRKDEIGQLAAHFQKMSKQLERSDKAKQEFVANVSHEIQSPLASIQGFADTLLHSNVDEQERLRYTGIIGQEARRLAALGRQLLLLSSLDHADYSFVKKAVPIQQQLRQALQLLEWQLSEKELSVRMFVPSTLTINGDEVLLMQIWSNLLSNAVKHIPNGRAISIRAFHEERNGVVIISDTGDGIPEEQLPYIYDRFFRGDSARERTAGSTGLGLSIVQRIVHVHGGTIEAQSQIGEGTAFRVSIPD